MDVGQLASDQIQKHIAKKFRGYKLAELVEAVLSAQGYVTQVSPPGGFSEPPLCAGPDGEQPVVGRHRWLPRAGGASDRLPRREASALLGAQDGNILEKVRKHDYDAVKAGAQAIYQAESRREAEQAFRRFRTPWRQLYTSGVKQLAKDLPELLTFFDFPHHLWRKLRTTNVIERCFVEVRRRTRPIVCFVNVASVDRIIHAIFNGLNENPEWKNRTLRLFTHAA